MSTITAVIGTAGRDATKPMTKTLWLAMTHDLHARLQPGDHLVSGGAAWADHLAVHAYLSGWCSGLTLYLPAPFERGVFMGPRSSAASAANFYHQQFTKATGVKGLEELAAAIAKGAEVHCEPSAPGYGGMFARNAKVAAASSRLWAYTFGEGAQPADGGTLDTWKKFRGAEKIHVPLMHLLQQTSNPTLQLKARHDPSLTVVGNWKDFCDWAKEAGYGEEYLDVNDSRCLALQRQYLEEQAETATAERATGSPGAA